MLTVEQALARVMTAATPLPTEVVGLEGAFDRLLAADLVAPRDLPPWDNSAMDGFAVVASDTSQVPVRLAVLETIAAGGVATRRVEPGSCARIMTGAPMPPGADAVVMVEDTETVGEHVEIRLSATPGKHVRRRGNDVRTGAVVLERGRRLDPAAVGLISSLGLATVPVVQKPVVAVLSTGDEVIEVGSELGPGQIYSANSWSLLGLVREAGGVGLHCGIAPDDPAGLRDHLRRCLRADLVLTTGGVSVGDFDFVKDAFDDVGAELDFWKVAMKPGKPLAFGSIGGRPAFGLPGNPVSCMVNFLQFVRPVMRTMMGDPRPFLPQLTARLETALPKRPGRALLARVALSREAGQVVARSVRSQSSGAVSSMVDADGFALLGADCAGLEVGQEVVVQVVRSDWAGGRTGDYPWAR